MEPKGQRKRRQKTTKEKLLSAALDVFSKHGYDAATTRNIAKRAGVNESLIHRYFESKFGLFVALTKGFRENMITQFLAYDESDNLEEDLTRFIKFRLQYTKRNKKFFRLSLSRAILDPKIRKDIQNYAQLKPPALMAHFERFRRDGQIRAGVEIDHVIGLIHILAFALSILVDAIECVSSEEAEQLIQTAAKILARGLSPKG